MFSQKPKNADLPVNVPNELSAQSSTNVDSNEVAALLAYIDSLSSLGELKLVALEQEKRESGSSENSNASHADTQLSEEKGGPTDEKYADLIRRVDLVIAAAQVPREIPPPLPHFVYLTPSEIKSMGNVLQIREVLLFEPPHTIQEFSELAHRTIQHESPHSVGIPVGGYFPAALAAFEKTFTSENMLTRFLHTIANEGFESWLKGEHSHLQESGSWWIEELKDSTGVIPQIEIPTELADEIRLHAKSVAEMLLSNHDILKSFQYLKGELTHQSDLIQIGARRIGAVLIAIDQLFSETVIDSSFARYSAHLPGKEGAVAYQGLAIVALDHVKKYFCSSLLNSLVTSSEPPVSLASLSALTSALAKAPGLQISDTTRSIDSRDLSHKEFLHLVRSELQPTIPSHTRAMFACHHNQQVLELAEIMNKNLIEECSPVPDFVRPRGHFTLARQLGTHPPISTSVTFTPEGQDEYYSVVSHVYSPVENTLSARNIVSMRKSEKGLSTVPTDFFVPLNPEELPGVEPDALAAYVQNLSNHLQSEAVEVWQSLPNLFSQSEHLNELTISFDDDSISIGCHADDRETVLGLIQCDLVFRPEQCLETEILLENSDEKLIHLRFSRSFFSPESADDEQEITGTPNTTLVEARNTASRYAGKFHTYRAFEKFLFDNFGVEKDEGDGKGSHFMLYREGFGYPFGKRVYNEEVPLRKTVILKALAGLGIQYEDFSAAVERSRKLV